MKPYILLLAIISLLAYGSSCGESNHPAPMSAQSSHNSNLSQNIREGNPIPPKGWKQVKSCGLAFYVPPDLREKKAQGDDSCLGWFLSKNTSLSLDVLMYTLDENDSRRGWFARKRDFQLEKILIDGRKAEIITCYDDDVSEGRKGLNYLAFLFMPDIGNERGHLTIWAYNRSAEDQSTSKKIFETVKFTRSGAPNNSLNRSAN